LRRGGRAHEFRPALRQQALVAPHAVLQVKLAHTGKVTRRRPDLARCDKIAVPVNFHRRMRRANPVQQLFIGEAMERIVVIHGFAQAAHRDQRIIVGILETCAGRRLQHLAASLVHHTPAAEIDPVCARTALATVEAARHLQQVADCDRPARIGAIVPVGNHGRIIDIDQPIAARGAQDGRGNRLADRPCPLRRLMVHAAGIAFGHDLSVTHDQHGAGARAIAIGAFVKSKRDRRFKPLGLFRAQLDLHVRADGAAPVLIGSYRPAAKMRQEGNLARIGTDRQLRTAKAGPPGRDAGRHGRRIADRYGL